VHAPGLLKVPKIDDPSLKMHIKSVFLQVVGSNFACRPLGDTPVSFYKDSEIYGIAQFCPFAETLGCTELPNFAPQFAKSFFESLSISKYRKHAVSPAEFFDARPNIKEIRPKIARGVTVAARLFMCLTAGHIYVMLGARG